MAGCCHFLGCAPRGGGFAIYPRKRTGGRRSEAPCGAHARSHRSHMRQGMPDVHVALVPNKRLRPKARLHHALQLRQGRLFDLGEKFAQIPRHEKFAQIPWRSSPTSFLLRHEKFACQGPPFCQVPHARSRSDLHGTSAEGPKLVDHHRHPGTFRMARVRFLSEPLENKIKCKK